MNEAGEEPSASERPAAAPQAARRTGSTMLLSALMARLADLGAHTASGSGRGSGGGGHRSITLRIGTARDDEAALAHGSNSLRAFMRSVHSFSQGSQPAAAEERRAEGGASGAGAPGPGEAGGDAGSADEEDLSSETAAAAAERHRLSAATGVDLQALAVWVEKLCPFLVIMLFIFVQKHVVGIAIFAWLTATLAKANEAMRRQVALKASRSRAACIGLAVAGLAHLPLVLGVWLPQHQLWRSLLLSPQQSVSSVWECLFRVTVVDAVVRLAGMGAKALVVVAARAAPEERCRRRGQVLTLVEHAVLLYRALLPTPAWVRYFEGAGLGSVLTACYTGLYLVMKCPMVYERVGGLAASARAVLRRSAVYGSLVPPGDPGLLESGNACSICQDPMVNPIRLRCNHIFCDACISEWLTRERTCPMCRAVIRPPGVHAFDDGATSLYPQIF